MMHVPSAYTEGYERARRHDPAGADSYLRHTGIGDPMLAPVSGVCTLPTAKPGRWQRRFRRTECGWLYFATSISHRVETDDRVTDGG